MATVTTEMVKVETLVPNERERAVQDKAALKELAATITAVGLIEPIVVTAAPGGRLRVIAGNRRLAAIHEAGLTEIPAAWVRVVDVDNETALIMRIVENLQREDVHPADELGDYEDLAKLGVSPADIAKKVGKTEKYVVRRLRLSSLTEAQRKGFREGKIGVEHAYIIARLPRAEDRDAAYKYVVGLNYAPSGRDFMRWVLRTLTLSLTGVPWKLDDAKLVPEAGACTACPKRTGNQQVLFDKAEEVSEELCMDGACYGRKMTAANAGKVVALKAAGRVVLTEGEAKKKLDKAIKAGTLTGQPTNLASMDYQERTYIQRLGPLHQEHCLNGCPNFATVQDAAGRLHAMCFDTKCLNRLLRKADAASESRKGRNGHEGKEAKAESGPSRKEHEKVRAKQIESRLRDLVDAQLIALLGEKLCLAKMDEPLARLALMATAKAFSTQVGQDMVQEIKKAVKPFDPIMEWGQASTVWKRIEKLSKKDVQVSLGRMLGHLAPWFDAGILPSLAPALGVDPKKQLIVTEEMLDVYRNDELEDVATEMKLTQRMQGEKKSDKIASLLPHLKPGVLPKAVVRVLEGAGAGPR